jgi:hypothetical protein
MEEIMKRRFIVVIFLVLFLISCGGSSVDVPMSGDITLTFVAASFSDWKLESASESGVGQVGATDPEVTLTVGRRYRIVSQSGSVHPFALSDQSTWSLTGLLLGENGGGSFATNAAVSYEDTDDGFIFTLSADLAAQLKTYICMSHSPMLGAIKVTGL